MDLYKDLPFKLPITRDFKTGKHRYNLGWSVHTIGDYSTWDIMFRVIENNVDKSFDMAFHYYCKLVPKYCQKDFLEQFYYCLKERYETYYLNQGIIRRTEARNKYNGPYKVKSIDFKITYRKIKCRKYENKIYDGLERWQNEKDFVKIVQGQIFEFESRKDPEYIKYKRKEAFVFNRRRKKEKEKEKEKAYSFKTEKEKELTKERETDILTRNRLGFDDTSFKGEFYHGRKNKII